MTAIAPAVSAPGALRTPLYQITGASPPVAAPQKASAPSPNPVASLKSNGRLSNTSASTTNRIAAMIAAASVVSSELIPSESLRESSV